MDLLTLFGLVAVTAMLIFYALEDRSPWYRDQLLRDFLRRASLQRLWGDEATVFAPGGGAKQDKLRVGEFDGHGRTLRVFDRGQADPGPSLTRAPDRLDRRG